MIYSRSVIRRPSGRRVGKWGCFPKWAIPEVSTWGIRGHFGAGGCPAGTNLAAMVGRAETADCQTDVGSRWIGGAGAWGERRSGVSMPASKVSSTIRRFSSTELRSLFTQLAVTPVICSEVMSTYPSWTPIDVPTSGSILNCSHFVQTSQTGRLRFGGLLSCGFPLGFIPISPK